MELAFVEHHFVGTHIGSANSAVAGEGEVIRRVEAVAEFHIIAGSLLRLTIVTQRILMTGNRHHHISGLDLLKTVGHIESNIEIIIGIVELICLKTHVGGTHSRTGSLCRAVEGEVRLKVEGVRDIHIITTHAMLCTVKEGAVMVTGNLNRHIAFLHIQITVLHFEGHILEVRVRVGELIGFDTHILMTEFGAGGRAVSTEGEAGGQVVKRSIGGSLITGHRVCGTIVSHRVIMTGNRHHSTDRSDGHIAVRDIEGHILEVRVHVGEHIAGQTHPCGVHNHAGSRIMAVEGNLRNIIQRGNR